MFLHRWSAQTYAAMRIIVGLLFFEHGSSKLLSFPVPPPPGSPPLIAYGAGGIELFCGALITLGALTHWAAFIASGEMAVAYFMAHFPRGFFPLMNQGESAVLYCFVFLYIAARGAGIWSVDGARVSAASAAVAGDRASAV